RTYLAFRPRVSSFSFGTLFFLTLPATSGISSLSLHDALPISRLLPYDGPVYYERSVLRKVARIKVPVYVFTGWEDMYSRGDMRRSEEHTSELQSPCNLVCRLLLEKKKYRGKHGDRGAVPQAKA